MLSQPNPTTFLPGLARFALAVQLARFGAAYPTPHRSSLTHFPSYGQELTLAQLKAVIVCD